MEVYKGLLITTEGLVKGELIVDDDIVFEEGECKPEFIFAPTIFNAHTHLGDSIAKEPPFLGLEELVGPKGYKFKVLTESDENELVGGIRNSIEIAVECGTTALLDFREGGSSGMSVLQRADEKGICLPLVRPINLEEAEILIDKAVGFGMSSTRDHDYKFLEDLREIARRKGRIFAIHAGERDEGDVEPALALEPDLLVHMNMASERLLRMAMDERIPIVSCIRSNAFFDLLNPKNYRILSEYDLWLLGTDNAMIAKPSMLEEMHFASLIVRDDLTVFKASIRGFELFGGRRGYIIFHTRKNFKSAKNVLATFVRRAGIEDIIGVRLG